jgi:hypothetical protein
VLFIILSQNGSKEPWAKTGFWLCYTELKREKEGRNELQYNLPLKVHEQISIPHRQVGVLFNTYNTYTKYIYLIGLVYLNTVGLAIVLGIRVVYFFI